MSRPILSTYRLQLTPDFGFADAAELVDYLAALGVTHLYLSPLLTAVPGSTHGYDVADPRTVSDALGGEDGLRGLADRAHQAGLGLVVDIVPNHLGTGEHNPLWELLLAEGRGGEGGRVFDVDWGPPLPTADGKVIVPVLGDQYGEVLHRGELTLKMHDEVPRLHYYEHSFPLSPETRDAIARVGGIQALNGAPGEPETWVRLHGLLERQHYRLVYWKVGDRLINYRRFFAINELAGVRVEDDHVFDLVHAKIIELVEDGVIDGLRIDHPDGLRDPARYLERLAERTGGRWNVVEKITQTASPTDPERLPEGWRTAGTTGYEFTNDVLGLFVDPDAEERFTELDRRFGGDPRPYSEQALAAKNQKLAADLAADVQRLARRFWALCQHHLEARDVDEASCYEVVSRIIARLPVYRTYVDPETAESSEADLSHVSAALEDARAAGTAPDRVYVLLANVLIGRAGSSPAHLDFLARFQQLSGALTAKGIEDTVFYRYRRMVALNEVGGEPTSFGTTTQLFHRRNAERALRHPAGMLTTATHDTKRGEDVRLRIAALTEIPDRWQAAVDHWGSRGIDAQTALLLYQTMVGVWPLSDADTHDPESLARRLKAYAEKATREAGQQTSWVDPVEDYERDVAGFIDDALADDAFTAEMSEVAAAAGEIAMVSSVAQVLLRITSPGVADTYQGNELWDESLVDPDNRRPVDFGRRRRLVDADLGDAWARRRDGRAKFAVLRAALRARRDDVACFDATSGYEPLATGGGHGDHVVAFARTDRGGRARWVTVAPRLPGAVMGAGLDAPLGKRWGDTWLELPGGDWDDVVTGGNGGHSGRVLLSDLLLAMPVALLSRKD